MTTPPRPMLAIHDGSPIEDVQAAYSWALRYGKRDAAGVRIISYLAELLSAHKH